MKLLRNFFRNLKYNLKFINKSQSLETNFFASSKENYQLRDLMNKYGSDKGNSNDHHNYTEVYSNIFFHKRDKIKNFLEVGLGTNNTELVSNMGLEGKPLASLRAWRDYFYNANIYGADIDKDILKNEERIKTYYVDQRDAKSISEMFNNIGAKSFDIILDDGLHEFNANINLFENSINYLNNDGFYIIEDVYYKDKLKFINYFSKTEYYFCIYDIFHAKNIANNILIVIRK